MSILSSPSPHILQAFVVSSVWERLPIAMQLQHPACKKVVERWVGLWVGFYCQALNKHSFLTLLHADLISMTFTDCNGITDSTVCWEKHSGRLQSLTYCQLHICFCLQQLLIFIAKITATREWEKHMKLTTIILCHTLVRPLFVPTNNPHETTHLFQSLFVWLQKFNTLNIHASFILALDDNG